MSRKSCSPFSVPACSNSLILSRVLIDQINSIRSGRALARDRFRLPASSALSVWKPRAASLCGDTLSILADFGDNHGESGWMTPQDTISLTRIVRADWEFNDIARRQKKVKSGCRVGGAGQKNRNMFLI